MYASQLKEMANMTQETKVEPRSRALAYELMGVLADVDNEGFDDVCYGTVQRVMQELLGGKVPVDFSSAVEEYHCTSKGDAPEL